MKKQTKSKNKKTKTNKQTTTKSWEHFRHLPIGAYIKLKLCNMSLFPTLTQINSITVNQTHLSGHEGQEDAPFTIYQTQI